MARPRTKRRNAFQTPNSMALGSSLGPMVSTAAELQPMQPAVTSPTDFFNLGGGDQSSSLMPALNPFPTPGSKPPTMRASDVQAKYNAMGVTPPQWTTLRGEAGGAGGSIGGEPLPDYIEPGEFAGVLARSPQAMSKLSPEVAAVLQNYAEEQATSAEQARAREAIQTIATPPTAGAAAAPDVEGTIGPQYTNRYWASRERQEAGKIREAFAAQRQALDADPSLPQEYRRIAKAQLQMQEQKALAGKRAEAKNRREDVETQLDMAMANAMLQRYQTAAPDLLRRQMGVAGILQDTPEYVTPFTGIETYLRQAGNDRLASLMGMRAGASGAGGSRVAGKTFGPVEGDTSGFGGFGGGVVATGSAPISQTPLVADVLERRRRKNPITSGAMGAGAWDLMGM